MKYGTGPKQNRISARALRWLAILACALVVTGLWGAWAGKFLVIDDPKPSDLIIVLTGDRNDVRLQYGLRLLRNGYAKEYVLDAPGWTMYGRSEVDLASEYLRSLAPNNVGRLHVCSFVGDSTRLELTEIAKCLHAIAPNARTAIVVTSAYHTRRALSVARHVLPEYSWTAAAAADPDFGTAWWRNREWAKTTLIEWQKVLWWNVVEKWQAHPHGNANAT